MKLSGETIPSFEQFVARDDVRDHVLRVLDELLTQNDIAFLKWDYNRNWSEPGWPGQAPEEQQKVYVAYVDHLYWILRQLRADRRTVARLGRPSWGQVETCCANTLSAAAPNASIRPNCASI